MARAVRSLKRILNIDIVRGPVGTRSPFTIQNPSPSYSAPSPFRVDLLCRFKHSSTDIPDGRRAYRTALCTSAAVKMDVSGVSVAVSVAGTAVAGFGVIVGASVGSVVDVATSVGTIVTVGVGLKVLVSDGGLVGVGSTIAAAGLPSLGHNRITLTAPTARTNALRTIAMGSFQPLPTGPTGGVALPPMIVSVIAGQGTQPPELQQVPQIAGSDAVFLGDALHDVVVI